MVWDIAATNVAEIMQIAPLPLFLLYNGFKADLQAEELYKWVLSLDNQADPYVTHAQNFLCVCLVKRNVNNSKTFVDPAVFMAMAPAAAKWWDKSKFRATYPALTQTTAQNANTVASNTSNPPGMAEFMIQMLAHHHQQQNQPPAGPVADKPEDVYSMSTTELDSLLALCGLPKGAYD
eukprot:15334222-Ditylum_brightwellii.AAC.1